MSAELTVVIPTLNEAAALPTLLDQLRRQEGVALEIVVADGGSTDDTVARARAAGARIATAARGRATQMNAGARLATAAHLLFLHADSGLTSTGQLRDAIEALRATVASRGPRCAGHFALRFSRLHDGAGRLFRYLEAKTALNRPGTVNGDQGLLLPAEFFRALGGYDESLPFLEDARIAERIFDDGHFIVLPGTLVTSARRFEREGPYRRYTLMSLIMGLHAAGANAFFDGAREIYAAQHETGALRLSPHLALVRRVLRDAGPRGALRILWRAGRFTRQNAWQAFFWWDVALGLRRRPLLRFHDAVVRPLTDNAVFDAVATAGISLWFLVALPLVYAVADRR